MNLPLVGITLFFLSGIVAGAFFPLSLPLFFLSAALVFTAAALFFRHTSWFLFFLGAAIFLGGAFSAQRTLYLFPPDHLSRSISGAEKARLQVVVSAEPYRQKVRSGSGEALSRVVVPAEALRLSTEEGWKNVRGKIRLNFYRNSRAREYEIGEKLELRARLRTVTKEGWGASLRRQRILLEGTVWGNQDVRSLGVGKRFWLKRQLAHLRNYLEEKLAYGLDRSEHRQILWGLIFGSRSDFSPELTQLFRRTNTYHVLAISGFNMTLVIALLTALLAAFRLPRRWVAAGMMVAIFFYMALIGWPPSATRAGLMSLVGLLAWALDREALALNTVALSALLILLFSPMQLFMPGFQLSYLVVLALLFWAQPIYEKLSSWFPKPLHPYRAKIQSAILLALSVSFIAWISVLPVLLNLFGAFALYSVLTNLLILFFVSALTYLGIATLFFNLISVNVGIYFNEVNAFLMNGLLAILQFFDKFPGCYWQFPKLSGSVLVLFYFAMLATLCARMTQKA